MREEDVERLEAEARARLRAAADADEVRAVERAYLEKGGAVALLLASIPSLPPAERGGAGRAANRLKTAVREAADARRAELERAALEAERSAAALDPTLPAPRPRRGGLHPVTRVLREVEEIFVSMGYRVEDGPEVELDRYNFEALNFDPDHPAREAQDTFFCRVPDRPLRSPADRLLLRTHTSPVQVRAMLRLEPPLRVLAPGRVFRHEQPDASHDHTFHQVEGLVVGEGIAVGHLVGTLRDFLRELFRRDVTARIRPGYFPFVEPGLEFDLGCVFCDGAGCRVCKQSGWIEFCGCGMVHPNVLRAGGIDPERWSGFAFGFGLDRLVMMRYGVDDIRHMMGGDLRFLEQVP